MAKGTFRKVKCSMRDGFVAIQVGNHLEIDVVTPSEDSENFCVIFRNSRTAEKERVFSIFAIPGDVLKEIAETKKDGGKL